MPTYPDIYCRTSQIFVKSMENHKKTNQIGCTQTTSNQIILYLDMLRIILLLDGGQRQTGQLLCSTNNPEISMLKPILRSPTRQISFRSNQSLNNPLLLQLPLQLPLQQHQLEPRFNPLVFHHIEILETLELHPLDHLNHLENSGQTLWKQKI